MELKQGIAIQVPVRLVAVVDGAPWTGITYQQAVVYVQKQGGASYQKVLQASDWVEIDALNMPGLYDLQLSMSDLDTLGFLKYTASSALVLPYPGLMQVVPVQELDTYNRIGAPGGPSISADIATAIAMVQRTLGLQFENAVQDQQEYDARGGLIACRLRIYDSRENTLAAGMSGLIASYHLEATFDETGAVTLFRMTKVS
jgi:hypothetical protein